MISGKILLVDDQPTAAQASIDALTNFVSKDQILYASTAAQAIQILDSTPLAAAFLDIDMPDTKNFSLAKYIDQKHKGLPYVFLTGYANFAAESYDYEPLDFLTKPIDVVRLEKTFARLTQKRKKSLPAKSPFAPKTITFWWILRKSPTFSATSGKARSIAWMGKPYWSPLPSKN